MNYKAVPFKPTISSTGSSNDAATQLESLINGLVGQGWDYVRLESVTTWVNGSEGCFGIGAKPGYNVTLQIAVFKK